MARILIADDDAMVRDVVRESLGLQGHEVRTACSGAEALTEFHARKFDLVILDCAMPGVSGIDALLQIRTAPCDWHTPVLMLTARRSSMDEEIAIRAGANDYLRKPFTPSQLVVRSELLLMPGFRSAVQA